MKIQFITFAHIEEAVKYLVSADGGHLPYTDESGAVSHRLMGAAWAALHGGYRGKKYEGPNKAAAITKLTALYKSEKMDTPEESYTNAGEFFQESLRTDDSFDSIRCKVMSAVNANIRAGIDMDGDDDGPQDAIEGKYAWCRDIFSNTVVYSMDDDLFQCDYELQADGSVKLGDPSEVEMSYTPVATTSATESAPRIGFVNSVSLQESAYDSAKGELTMTIIKPGLSKNDRNYPAGVLKRSVSIFENAKMFADHQTEAQQKSQPEGSVNNWVASVKKVWAESDGRLRAKAVVIDPQFKTKLDKLNENGLLSEMGVSIRAVGTADDVKIDGRECKEVTSLLACRSVDFVTYAGAGGQVEAMESNKFDDWDVDVIGEAEFRQRRPDLVTLIEKHIKEEIMKTDKELLTEATAKITALETEKSALQSKLTEAETKGLKATAASELNKLLSESKLPEAAQNKIKKQFAEATKVEGMKEAITEEAEYLKTLGAPTKTSKNLGASQNGTDAIEAAAKTSAETQASLVKSYQLMGLSEADAKVAAGV